VNRTPCRIPPKEMPARHLRDDFVRYLEFDIKQEWQFPAPGPGGTQLISEVQQVINESVRLATRDLLDTVSDTGPVELVGTSFRF
jgi:hypothetical protein